jgi:hypothetical protein
MSDRIPMFQIDDRVRVMQTREMEQCGWANKTGVVTALLGVAEFQQARIAVNGGGDIWVPCDSLMAKAAQ